MKRSDFSIELKDWVPGVYSTLEAQLQLIAEYLDVEFCMGKRGVGSVYYNSESLQPKKLAECYVKFHKENFVN